MFQITCQGTQIPGLLVLHFVEDATSIGQLMTEKLETIGLSSTAQQASKKMRDKNVSSLIVVDDDNIPVGIITERDLVINYASGKSKLIQDLMSFPLVTADALLSVEVAADKMMQNKVRHLLVVEDDDITKPLGIVTSNDFVAYLKENLNIDDANASLLEFTQEQNDEVIEKLEEQGELPKDVLEASAVASSPRTLIAIKLGL